jgi:hypothetical protein
MLRPTRKKADVRIGAIRLVLSLDPMRAHAAFSTCYQGIHCLPSSALRERALINKR